MRGHVPTFAFSGASSRKVHHTRRSRRSKKDESSSDQQSTDGVSVDANSLTYSAASSVNSGGSAAGESTDSSFADIMKVLDLQDRDELAALMKKEGLGDYRKQLQKMSSSQSVASSLAYSTDQESALESTLGGEALLQNLTGQPTDGYGPDLGDALGSFEGDEPSDFDIDNNILFAPADPFDKKKKKANKASRTKPELKTAATAPASAPRTPEKDENSSGGSVSTPTPRSPDDVKMHTRSNRKNMTIEDESCTPRWLMCGFSEAFRDLLPTNW